MSKGIDYSCGRSNFDAATGIHYGVISQHSVMPEALNDLEPYYGDPTCPQCSADVTDGANAPEDAPQYKRGSADYYCTACNHTIDSEHCFPDESSGFTYKQDGYELTDCLDTDIFVLKSPYYTHAQFCSPCVPGAGNLDSACDDGVKTFCLGHDWFEDGKAPYPVYSVETNALVSE